MVNNSSFLCGYFSAHQNPVLSSAWQQHTYTPEERSNLQNYYFPEFAQCMADDITMYTLPIDKDCSLILGDEKVVFHVRDLKLWVAPFHIILYAVSLRFENQEFNTVTRTLNSLRNCPYYTEAHDPFIALALQPIIAIFKQTALAAKEEGAAIGRDHSWLVESGNKFKIFQIMQPLEPIQSGDEDLMLYDAGTLAPHTPLSTGINSPEYIAHILEGHKVSVFAGWTGLALLDTFTSLTTNTPERVISIWEKDYFEKIYVYQLFRKVFLYSVNLRYRRRTEDVVALEQQLDLFEQKYSYTAISYNFLPNIINFNMEKSLNTQRDYDQLNRMISKEIEARREQGEEKTNKFLTFLTCLTIFSAVYDCASLINESFGYDTIFPNGFIGFRLVGTVLLLSVVIVYFFLSRKK